MTIVHSFGGHHPVLDMEAEMPRNEVGRFAVFHLAQASSGINLANVTSGNVGELFSSI